MTMDEHPEQLLDRALDGDLDAAERAALDLHLRTCSACMLHLDLATRLGNGAVAPVARDEALNRLAIGGALARLKAQPRASAWRFGGMSLRLAAACGMLFAGLAAAAVSFRTAQPRRGAPETTQMRAPPAHPGASGGPVSATPSETPATSPPIVDGLAPEAKVTAPLAPPASTRRGERATKIAPSAAALFGWASDLRHQGRADEAIDTYRSLQQRYPRTREANLSYALTGRLQLERDRPAQALAEFDRYLEVDTEVAEEALAWRTEALRRLGRRHEEAAAWRLLLTRFPRSIYSEQAHLRLAALDSPSSLPPGPVAPRRR